MFFALFEILTNFIQYLAILASLRIEWPNEWLRFLSYARYLRLDLSLPIPYLDFPPLDFRAQHVLLTSIVPLLLSLSMLVLFKPTSIVAGYFITLSAIGGFIAGLVLKFLPHSRFSSVGPMADFILIICGALLVGAAIVVELNRFIEFRKRRKIGIMVSKETIASDQESEVDLDASNNIKSLKDLDNPDKLYPPKGWIKQTRNFLIAAACLAAGLIGTQIVSLNSRISFRDFVSRRFLQLGQLFSVVILFAGVVMLYVWAVNIFLAGRKFTNRVTYFVRKNILSVALLILSLLYIPITNSLVNTVNCFQATCGAGTQFLPNSIALSVSSVQDSFIRPVGNSSCFACAKNCSINGEEYCPAVSEWRLISDPSISCTKEMYLFYVPGSAVMFLVFTLGTPYLFYTLIKISAIHLAKIPAQADSELEKWHIRVYLSQNSSKSLYSDFNPKWRYFKLILIAQKLVLVLLFIVGTFQPLAFSFCLLVTNAVFGLLSMYSMPYHQRLINYLSVACFLINAANALVTVLIAFGISVNPYSLYGIAALNIVVPTILTVVAMRGDRMVDNSIKRKAVASLKFNSQDDLKGSKETLDKDFKRLIYLVDMEMNKDLLQTVVNFAMAVGIAALISLCFVLVGMLYQSSNSTFLSYTSTPADFSNDIEFFEFASWDSWADFSSNCCCQASPLDHGRKLVELWKCKVQGEDGHLFKERLRSDGNTKNGLVFRDFCSKTFKRGVVCGRPTFNTTFNRYQPLLCPNQTAIYRKNTIDLW